MCMLTLSSLDLQGFVSETGESESPTPTEAEAGKTAIPSDDHKVSDYRSEETVSSQQTKSSAPEQTGMPNTTEASRSHRSGSQDRASKQNLRENELIRTKRRLQAKHRYSLELKHSGDYIDRPLNSLVATSSTWIHPHICVTSASRQLKDLLDLEHLNSLARIQHTAKSRHVKEGTQEVRKWE